MWVCCEGGWAPLPPLKSEKNYTSLVEDRAATFPLKFSFGMFPLPPAAAAGEKLTIHEGNRESSKFKLIG